MWQDALRVCKEYIPNKLQALQDEYEHDAHKTATKGIDTLVNQAREWESSGDYQRAVDTYVKVNENVTNDVSVMAKCWVRVSTLYDCLTSLLNG